MNDPIYRRLKSRLKSGGGNQECPGKALSVRLRPAQAQPRCNCRGSRRGCILILRAALFSRVGAEHEDGYGAADHYLGPMP